MGQVGDAVGVAHAQPLGRVRRRVDPPRVRADAVTHLPGEVAVLQHFEDAQALRRVVPAAGDVGRQRVLAGVAERGVADVVGQRDRLGQRLVEAQAGGQGPGDLRDLQGVREPGDDMVAVGVGEHLRLVLEPAEGLGVHDAVAVALEAGAPGVLRLRPPAPAAVGRTRPGGSQALRLLGQSGGTVAARETGRDGCRRREGAHEPRVRPGCARRRRSLHTSRELQMGSRLART